MDLRNGTPRLGDKQTFPRLDTLKVSCQILLYFVNANCCHFINTFQTPDFLCRALYDC